MKIALDCPPTVSKFSKLSAAVVRHDQKFKIFSWKFGLLDSIHQINPFHRFDFETDDGKVWNEDE